MESLKLSAMEFSVYSRVPVAVVRLLEPRRYKIIHSGSVTNRCLDDRDAGRQPLLS